MTRPSRSSGRLPPQLPYLRARAPRIAPWLWAPMRAQHRLYASVIVAAVLVNLFMLASSFFSMTIYDRVIPNNARASLIGLAIGMVIVILFDFTLRMLRGYFIDVAGANIDRSIGSSLFDQLLALPLARRQGSTGALTGLVREIETLRDVFTSATLVALVDLPFILLFLLVITLIGGPVVFVPLVMVPLVMLVAWGTQPAMDRLSAAAMTDGLTRQSVLVETLGGLETVKASGAGPLLRDRWLAAITHHATSAMRQRLVAAITINVATSAQMIAYAGVVVVGAFLVGEQRLTAGGLIACSMLASRAVAPLTQIAQLIGRLTATRTAYRQIDALMSEAPEGPGPAGLRPMKLEGAITLSGVSFRYPGQAHKALDSVSLSIAPGEHVALLGRVGSGKSTLARLILGLYAPDEGVVQIDGVSVDHYDPARLRARIGAALQDNVLVSGRLGSAITLEREGVDETEMLRVARLSGAHDFVGRLADGYALCLADRGEGLSGGQRQAIALARALAGRPDLLILDEPTSAMDARSEAQLIERLKTEIAGRTLIVITHRPSLIALVDRVIVLEQGRVIADDPAEKVRARLAAGARQEASS